MPQIALPSAPPLSNPPGLVSYSQAVGTSSALLVPAATAVRHYLQIINVSGANGPNLWLCWANPAAANTHGSFVLGPYGNSSGYPSVYELGLTGGCVFPLAIYGISDSGSGTPVQATIYVA